MQRLNSNGAEIDATVMEVPSIKTCHSPATFTGYATTAAIFYSCAVAQPRVPCWIQPITEWALLAARSVLEQSLSWVALGETVHHDEVQRDLLVNSNGPGHELKLSSPSNVFFYRIQALMNFSCWSAVEQQFIHSFVNSRNEQIVNKFK